MIIRPYFGSVQEITDGHYEFRFDRKGINMPNTSSETQSLVGMQLDMAVTAKNHGHIHGALNLAMREKMSPQLISLKVLELAVYYQTSNDLAASIDVLESGFRHIPTDIDIIDAIGRNLASFIEDNISELCDADIRWVSEFLGQIESTNYSKIGGHHQLEHTVGIRKLKAAVRSISCKNDSLAEGRYTHFLSSLSLRQFKNLTEEERKEKVTEIFARKIWELEQERKKAAQKKEGIQNA